MASLNAGPEYYAAEEKYRSAKTVDDKLSALQEMLRLAPKHKSSESLLLEIKSKIAKVRKEAAIEVKKRKAAGKGQGDFVKRQGGSQIVLVGFANAGKTTLFNCLTSGKDSATHVPFETVSVTPRMWNFNKVQIQVLDTPSITEQNANLIFSVSRVSDLAIVIIDPLQDIPTQLNFFNSLYSKKMVIFSKKDLKPQASANYKQFNFLDGANVEKLKNVIFEALELVRVFTKAPRSSPDFDNPIVMKKTAATVSQVARQIHKDMYAGLKFAKVWGSTKFGGQQVSSEYELADGDVVELHMK